MSYYDPLQVDTIFQETIRLIAASPSERIQLNLIDRFLDFIEGNEEQFESYIQQILLKLPALDNPLLYAGVRPEIFQGFISKLEKYVEVISDSDGSDEIHSKILSYKVVLSHIYNWIRERYSDDILNDSVTIFEAKPSSSILGHVLIPTVEEMDGMYSGRLRKLHVDIISKSKSGNKLKAAFGVIGADAGSFTLEAEKAVDVLVNQTDSIKHSWNAAILFEMPNSWHAGKSANLAIAGAFYCEILKAEEQQEMFWLNPAACISGEVDKNGDVLPVAEGTLKLKVEAAFFSWVHVLVVPQQQLDQAQSMIKKLNSNYPNRDLPVIAVATLKELFFDRRVTLYNKIDTLTHNFNNVWRRRNSAVVALILLFLLVVIGRLIYGPIDRNPVNVDLAGSTLFLKNSQGMVVDELEVGANLVDFHNKGETGFVKYLLTDVDGDNYNDLIYSRLLGFTNNLVDTVFCYSISRKEYLWKSEVNIELDYSHRPDVLNDTWSAFGLIELNGVDGEYFLLISQRREFFPASITKVRKTDGEFTEIFVNPGRIIHLVTEDINGDDNEEILYVGQNNSFWGAHLGVLNSRDIIGSAPATDSYTPLNFKQHNVLAYIQFPRTIVGRKLRNQKGTTARLVYFKESTGLITTQILEYFDSKVPGNETPLMVYHFDNNFELVGLGSSDAWDIEARNLKNVNLLPYSDEIEYLNAFKDSLQWWNGNEFVNQPTLVNGQLLD